MSSEVLRFSHGERQRVFDFNANVGAVRSPNQQDSEERPVCQLHTSELEHEFQHVITGLHGCDLTLKAQHVITGLHECDYSHIELDHHLTYKAPACRCAESIRT